MGLKGSVVLDHKDQLDPCTYHLLSYLNFSVSVNLEQDLHEDLFSIIESSLHLTDSENRSHWQRTFINKLINSN